MIGNDVPDFGPGEGWPDSLKAEPVAGPTT
jgi:hypothetical protein